MGAGKITGGGSVGGGGGTADATAVGGITGALGAVWETDDDEATG